MGLRDRGPSAAYDCATVGKREGDRISILIVDDHRTFGEALELSLKYEPDIEVVDVVTDGETAVETVAEKHPDVVIMDLSMPGVDGIEATRRIKATDPDARVVVLSGIEEENTLARVVQAGGSGLLRKTEAVAEVASSVRRVARGEMLIDEEEADRALRQLRHRRQQDASMQQRLGRLTPRELEILQLMAEGMNSSQIAKKLGMSPHTLRTHVQNVLTKLGVHSKLEALMAGIRHGVITTARIP